MVRRGSTFEFQPFAIDWFHSFVCVCECDEHDDLLMIRSMSSLSFSPFKAHLTMMIDLEKYG